MKTVTSILLALMISNAHASWIETKCSSSDGSVSWESSDNQNIINLKYANFVEGTLVLDLDQVNIQFLKEHTFTDKTFRSCEHDINRKVFVGQVRIKASNKNPNALRSHFPLNRVETEVICTQIIHNATNC